MVIRRETVIPADQIKARYHAGTMGYDSCRIYLQTKHRMTEADVDALLFPIPSGKPGPKLLADLFSPRKK